MYVCLPPHACWNCVEAAKHILRLSSPSGSHTVLVFPYQTVLQYSTPNGDPPNGGIKCVVVVVSGMQL